MQVDIPIIVGIMGALVSALYFFIRRDLKGNGTAELKTQVSEMKEKVHSLYKWHEPKDGRLQWYSEHEILSQLQNDMTEMKLDNAKAHLEIATMLRMLAEALRKK